MNPVILSLEPQQETREHLTVAASLKHPDGQNLRLWWKLPMEWAPAVTNWADPFVLGMLFPMMQWGKDVLVEGLASPSLLENLETFMANWHAWVPGRYQPVQIRAREEVESPAPSPRGETVIPFSCGLDSCFTAFRHRRGLMGRRNHNITAAVTFHGFDIWLDQPNSQSIYNGVLDRARILLDSLGIPGIAMAGNFHELPTTWGHSFGTQLVSGLSLLGGRFEHTLIPNNIRVARLGQIWASHPMNDPLLGKMHFTVQDDGGETARYERARLVSQWPEAMRHLRVCYRNPINHENCCRCEKCIRTMVAFRVAGCPHPPAFAQEPTLRQIAKTNFQHQDIFWIWQDLLKAAQEHGLGSSDWAKVIRATIRRNRVRWAWRKFTRKFIPVRNALRFVFRGSTLNRRQLNAQTPSPAAVDGEGDRG